MEEWVGSVWDQWISNHVNTDHKDASVNLCDLQSELKLFFNAMGGDKAKTIELADARKIKVKRTTLQTIAGSHRKFYVPWQDERSVHLPPNLAIFPEARLNESLYFWQTAMAVHLPIIKNWVCENQQAVITITQRYPGLKRQYDELRDAFFLLCRSISDELKQALEAPGTLNEASVAQYSALPIYLWMYKTPVTLCSVSPEDVDSKSTEKKSTQNDARKKMPIIERFKQRKQAQRIDDNKKTDGLLIFQAESIMSWAEHVNLDRCQDDENACDVEKVAEDLDFITLARKRHASAAKVKFDLDLPAEVNDELPIGEGTLFPEWHYKKNKWVADYCLVQPLLADRAEPCELPQHLTQTARKMKQQFVTIGLTPSRQFKQPSGQEIDLDTWLDHYALPVKDSSQQQFYVDTRRQQRDIACLVLADLSLSTQAYVNDTQQVIDVIRDSLFVLSESLSALGDPFALYGFSSVKNTQIRFHLIKNFNERYGARIRGRISQIKPGFYTRIGAAIRQSSEILKRTASANRLLLIISDGKPNDLDQYEGRHGIEDTRQAVMEAKRSGLLPYCVTVDQEGHQYLPYVFGSNGFCVVNNPSQLALVLPKLYLSIAGSTGRLH